MAITQEEAFSLVPGESQVYFDPSQWGGETLTGPKKGWYDIEVKAYRAPHFPQAVVLDIIGPLESPTKHRFPGYSHLYFTKIRNKPGNG